MKLLVTGGAGFIGSNFVNWILNSGEFSEEIHKLVVLDSLTYAGNLANLDPVLDKDKMLFVKGDIRDEKLVKQLLEEQEIDTVVNFAAESHVDRSILNPLEFVRTNIEGTQVLVNCSRDAGIKKYVQISTDEVYGSLGPEGKFVESTPLDPSSAYSASKASGDLLVLAAFRTHGFPAAVTRCTNNYGPYQFPEKLIPLFVTNAMADEKLPVYGDGKNVRSWLHVDDHSRAIAAVILNGRSGEVYNIGGGDDDEKENIEVTKAILKELGKPDTLLNYVEDRKGHDRRYAIDFKKINEELGWSPKIKFEDGLRETINWYVSNQPWWKNIKSGDYLNYYKSNYGTRKNVSSPAVM